MKKISDFIKIKFHNRRIVDIYYSTFYPREYIRIKKSLDKINSLYDKPFRNSYNLNATDYNAVEYLYFYFPSRIINWINYNIPTNKEQEERFQYILFEEKQRIKDDVYFALEYVETMKELYNRFKKKEIK